MLMLILAVVLILTLVSSLLTRTHTKDWRYFPSVGLELVAVVLLVFFLLGRL
jgi:hypothetical protein